MIDGQLGTWDVTGLGNGPHTLRVLVRAGSATQYEGRVRVFVDNIPPTATPEATPTWTLEAPTPTLEAPTPTPEAPTPTIEFMPLTEVPTDVPTQVPTDTPVPPLGEALTATPEPPTPDPGLEATPTWTPEVVAASSATDPTPLAPP